MQVRSSATAESGPTAIFLIGEGLVRVIRLYHRNLRQRADAGSDTELSTARILGILVRGGPARLTALATETNADMSTISRQVADLVRRGLLQRRPDPADRRAGLLVVTERGYELHQQHLENRSAYLAKVLANWSAHDRTELARLLLRFTDDLSKHGDPFAAAALHRTDCRSQPEKEFR